MKVLILFLVFIIASGVGSKKVVTIVVYDKIKGYLNWLQDWFRQAALDNCNTKCILKEYDESTIKSANIVLFHAPTRDQSHPSFPAGAPQNAIYALLSMEQPKYARVLSDFEALKKFNVLLTYSLKSNYPGTNIPNLPITYFPLHILSPQVVLQPARPFIQKAGYNTGVSVAMFTSNCHNAGATERLNYLTELMRYIGVHSYGKCLNNRQEPSMPDDPGWPSLAQRRARKVKVLSHYKFYLAFENLGIEDYVSEKVFEGLFAGSVPVYRGSSTVHKFMPSNSSFINANDLSPKQLAELLKKIAADEREYNQYLAFKKDPLPTSFEEIALLSYVHPNVLCRLCDYAVSTTMK